MDVDRDVRIQLPNGREASIPRHCRRRRCCSITERFRPSRSPTFYRAPNEKISPAERRDPNASLTLKAPKRSHTTAVFGLRGSCVVSETRGKPDLVRLRCHQNLKKDLALFERSLEAFRRACAQRSSSATSPGSTTRCTRAANEKSGAVRGRQREAVNPSRDHRRLRLHPRPRDEGTSLTTSRAGRRRETGPQVVARSSSTSGTKRKEGTEFARMLMDHLRES